MYSTIMNHVRGSINPIIHLTEEAPVMHFSNSPTRPRFFDTAPAFLPGRAVQKIPRSNYDDLGRLVPISWL